MDLNERLMDAVENGSAKDIRFLIYIGADLNTKDIFGRTAQMKALMYGNTEVAELLIQNGADVVHASICRDSDARKTINQILFSNKDTSPRIKRERSF